MFRREVLPPLEIQRKPPRDRGSMKKGDCDTMKKFLALILTLAMALSVTACGGSDDTADDTADGEGSGTEETADYASMTDDELKAAITTVEGGKLIVATSPDFAPYEFYSIDESGNAQLAGFDIALSQYIADYLGLELVVNPMDFNGVLTELQTKHADLGMAGLSPDPEREGIMDFSDIYYMGGQSFVCLESNKDKFPTLEDTNNPEYSIAAQTGSIQYNLAEEHSPEANIVSLAKVTDIVAELVAGKIDGGQTEAARSLGLSQRQNLRFIILPQAVKNILPAIANEFVVIIKESAITYTIGVQDIMGAVNNIRGATFLIMEPLLVATALYFCLCFPTSKIIAYFERRMSRGDRR